MFPKRQILLLVCLLFCTYLQTTPYCFWICVEWVSFMYSSELQWWWLSRYS